MLKSSISANQVYPTSIRALASGISIAVFGLAAISTQIMSLYVADEWRLATIIVYGAVGVVAGVAALLLPFETRGKKPEELQAQE